MPFDPCDPCSCVPGNMGKDAFMQGVITLLCDIAGGETGNFPFAYHEDTAFTNGDIGAYVLGVRNTALADTTTTDGDFSSFSTNIKAALFVDINASAQQSNPLGLLKLEDAAAASGDAGVAVFSQQQATPTNTVSGDSDYQTLKGNIVGALYIEPANQVATPFSGSVAGAAGGVPTTGVSLVANAGAAKFKILFIGNTLDVAVLISTDGGTTYPIFVPATSGTAAIDLGASGRWTASAIFAKGVTNSSSGTLYGGAIS